jgi:hypothetical protein
VYQYEPTKRCGLRNIWSYYPVAGQNPIAASGLKDLVENFQMNELRNLLAEVNDHVDRA